MISVRLGRLSGGRRALIAASLLLAVTVSACGGPAPSDSSQASVSGAGVIELSPVADRRELSRITGRLLDGANFDSEKLLGDVVVYNVWGSWCAPCREEAPALREASNQYQDEGVQFVGINVRDNDAAALAFERRYDISYPSITTADSAAALMAFGPDLPPSAVPSTVIVDPEGRVAARVIGKVSHGTLTALLDEILAEEAGA